MALVCPSCGTENRSVAKFCIECIAALPVGFEATQLAPRPAPRESPASEGMPTALAAFAAAPPSQPQAWVRSPAPPIPPAPPAPEAKGRTGLWVSVGALAIALVVGAAGWAAAGAGGWYIYKEKVSSSGEEREPAVTQAAPSVGDSVRAPVAATSMAAASSLPAATADAPVAAAPMEATASAPSASALSEPTPPVASTLAPGEVLVAGASGARQDAPPRAEAHSTTPVAAAPARVAHKPYATTVPAPATSSLAKACDGMNFIAAARCKVTECAKPALRQTAECKVVQAQQRLMEEKRNPTLAN